MNNETEMERKGSSFHPKLSTSGKKSQHSYKGRKHNENMSYYKFL